MSAKLFFSAIIKFLLGVVLVFALVFLPAGTLKYAQGWLFMGLLFVPMFVAGVFMMIKNPQLLKKRLNGKEKLKEQNLVIKLSGLMFITGFVIAGLNFRFELFMLPLWASLIASALFLFAYVLYALVMKQNPYLSRTVEVQQDQSVIDTGVYSVVRHPMYSATLLLFIMIPLVLGSVFALPVFLLYPFIIAKRLLSEEEFLKKELAGYNEYMKKVRYRLIPFVW